MFKKEVGRLVKIGNPKRANGYEWGAPSFVQPKWKKCVMFLSDFRNVDRQLKYKPCPMTKNIKIVFDIKIIMI